MIPKSYHWKAIKMICRDCRGDSRDDSVCRDIAGWGPCPLFPYCGKAKRRGPDGKMLPIYSIKEMRRRWRRHCVFCMNGNPISHCQDHNCPAFPIVIEGRNQGKGDGFSGKASERRPEALSETDTPSKRITGSGFPSNIAASAYTTPGGGGGHRHDG